MLEMVKINEQLAREETKDSELFQQQGRLHSAKKLFHQLAKEDLIVMEHAVSIPVKDSIIHQEESDYSMNECWKDLQLTQREEIGENSSREEPKSFDEKDQSLERDDDDLTVLEFPHVSNSII